jgi:hypothetical protein
MLRLMVRDGHRRPAGAIGLLTMRLCSARFIQAGRPKARCRIAMTEAGVVCVAQVVSRRKGRLRLVDNAGAAA